jgi:hypothetical protein
MPGTEDFDFVFLEDRSTLPMRGCQYELTNCDDPSMIHGYKENTMAGRQRHHVFVHLGERAYGTHDIKQRNLIFLLAIDATDRRGYRIGSAQHGVQIRVHHQELFRNARKALVDESWHYLKSQPKN